jgi:outer membrane protein insertion porin family
MKHACIWASFLLAGAIPFAAAQTYTATQIVFDHPGPYTQDQLETAAGMHSGAKFNVDDLSAATQRLADTGYFESVGPSIEAKGDKISILFDLKLMEHAKMLHAGFENFVWLDHAEIEQALRAKSPLFQDYLPEDSSLEDTFDAALSGALAAKGITAKVMHETVEPTILHPERSIEFQIVTPLIKLSNVRLDGVPTELAPKIQKSVSAAIRLPYNDGLVGQTTEDCILTPLFDAGYIQASLSGVTLATTQTSDGVTVVLSATINVGDVYHVSKIGFSGSPLLSAESFAATQKLHSGDTASRALLFETLAPLDAAYRRQGYMNVIVKVAPSADVATHQVAYAVSVDPGEQYRIHELTANGLDPAAKADFERGFLMKAGELYNPEYVSGFLKNNTSLRALVGYSAGFKAYANPNTHTVDLVLTFVRGIVR